MTPEWKRFGILKALIGLTRKKNSLEKSEEKRESELPSTEAVQELSRKKFSSRSSGKVLSNSLELLNSFN